MAHPNHDQIVQKFIDYLNSLDNTTADEAIEQIMKSHADKTDSVILVGNYTSAETAMNVVKDLGRSLAFDMSQSLEFWINMLDSTSQVATHSLSVLHLITVNPAHKQCAKYFGEVQPIVRKILHALEAQSNAENPEPQAVR